eukprot:jgi/Hompol1/4821/HPOL_003990-RA
MSVFLMKAHELEHLLEQAITGGITSIILLQTDGSLLSYSGLASSRAKTIAAVVSNAWYAYDRHARPPPSAAAPSSVGLRTHGTDAVGSDADGMHELVIESEGALLAIKGVVPLSFPLFNQVATKVSIMGKRDKRQQSNADAGAKRPRTGQHTDGCVDRECTGCAAGEIDIDIRLVGADGQGNSNSNSKSKSKSKNKHGKDSENETENEPASSSLTAADLHQAALDELNKPQLSAQDVDEQTHRSIVARLFELALERFAEADNSNRATEANAEIKSTSDVDRRRAHAACLLDFALFMAAGWVLLGRIYVAIAQYEHYNPADIKPIDGDYDEDEDEDEDSRSLPVKKSARAIKEEQQLVKDALDAFERAAISKIASNHQAVIRQAAKSLLVLAHSQRIYRCAPSTVCASLEASIKYASEYNSHQVDQTDSAEIKHTVLRTEASARYWLASMLQHASDESELNQALQHAKIAVNLIKLLGESSMLISSLESEDDDAAIAAFEDAVTALKKALELDPDNEDLARQLNDVNMMDMNEVDEDAVSEDGDADWEDIDEDEVDEAEDDQDETHAK